MEETNRIYEATVDSHVRSMLWQAVDKYKELGFTVMTPTGLLHEGAIRLAGKIQGLDDEKALKVALDIVRPFVMRD